MLTDKASIKKGIRFWSVGILGGLLVMLGASLYFIDHEKKEAEARLYRNGRIREGTELKRHTLQ